MLFEWVLIEMLLLLLFRCVFRLWFGLQCGCFIFFVLDWMLLLNVFMFNCVDIIVGSVSLIDLLIVCSVILLFGVRLFMVMFMFFDIVLVFKCCMCLVFIWMLLDIVFVVIFLLMLLLVCIWLLIVCIFSCGVCMCEWMLLLMVFSVVLLLCFVVVMLLLMVLVCR